MGCILFACVVRNQTGKLQFAAGAWSGSIAANAVWLGFAHVLQQLEAEWSPIGPHTSGADSIGAAVGGCLE